MRRSWSSLRRGPVFDDYLFVGEPMAALRSYTRLTGKPVAVPDWAMTPWMGGGVARWNIAGADKSCDQVRAAVQRMHDLDIPHGAIYIEGLPTDKPNGKALVTWLNQQNLKPLAWYGPNAAPTEGDSFLPEQLAHLFVHGVDGTPFVVPTGRFLAGSYYIDFTNPLSVEMLVRRWKWHIDEGIRGCMIDGGEEFPRDGTADNGLTGASMHNLYPLFYHRAHQSMFDQLIADDYVLFGRSGAPGDQSSMGQFPGDLPGDFSGLTGRGLRGTHGQFVRLQHLGKRCRRLLVAGWETAGKRCLHPLAAVRRVQSAHPGAWRKVATRTVELGRRNRRHLQILRLAEDELAAVPDRRRPSVT